MSDQVLVGDVGGTNVRFGCASRTQTGIEISNFLKVPGDNYDNFEDAFAYYLDRTPDATADIPAVFALAGPAIGGSVKLTNRNWTVSADRLQNRFGCSSIKLVNDFTAMARAVPEVERQHFEDIRPGTAHADAPIIVAGPGTGFGVATLVPRANNAWRVLSGEGGYMSYAPETDIEVALANQLRKTHGYVPTELVCAGVGLNPVHSALCEIFDRDYEDISPGDMLERAAAGDEMFRELCHIRARGTMTAVGDLVLVNGALGGVVLAGGVSERLAPYLKAPDAIARFEQRGRNSHYLSECPISLMHDPAAPLIGAAALHLKDAV